MIRSCLLLALIVFGFFAHVFATSSAYAQTVESRSQPPASSSEELADYLLPETAPGTPRNISTFSQSVVIGLLSTVTCALSGMDPLSVDRKCLQIDPETRVLGYSQESSGAVGLVGGLIAATYQKPASGIGYVSHMASNFGVTKTAYAQDGGIGFAGLEPVREVWEAMRNIVYLLFVLVFVLIGLGIMLRLQIDPRTVMTVQNQIPKIIIGLILVTFSYAIAGFMIDLMFVAIGLLFAVADPLINYEVVPSLNQTPFGFADELFRLGGTADLGLFEIEDSDLASIPGLGILTLAAISSSAIADIFTNIVSTVLGGIIRPIFDLLGYVVSGQAQCDIGEGVFGIIPGVGGYAGEGFGFVCDKVTGVVAPPREDFDSLVGNVGGLGQVIVGVLSGLIAAIIVLIAMLWSLLKVWFALLKAFIMILIGVVFAPFWIALGLIPGSSQGFGTWIRFLLSNIAVFPAVVGMLLLARIFMEKFGVSFINGSFARNITDGFSFVESASTEGIVPPLIGDAGSGEVFGALIGLGFVLLTPSAVEIVRKAFQTEDLGFTSAIGQSLKQGAGVTAALPTRMATSSLRPPDQYGREAGALFTKLTGVRDHGELRNLSQNGSRRQRFASKVLRLAFGG